MQSYFQDVRPKGRPVYAVGAAVIALLVIILCVVRGSLVPVGCSRLPSPQESVDGFFTALCSGDYDACDGYISGYSTLGMNVQPSSEVSRVLREKLNESYSYSFAGECSVRGMEASQDVEITYLDLSLLGEPLRQKTNEIAERMNFEGIEIHDEEAAENAMLEAIEQMSGELEKYYVTEKLTIDLVSDGSCWKLRLDSGLSRVLIGNAGNA